MSTGGGPKVTADKVVHATMMPLVANLAVVSRQVPERAYYLAIDCPKVCPKSCQLPTALLSFNCSQVWPERAHILANWWPKVPVTHPAQYDLAIRCPRASHPG